MRPRTLYLWLLLLLTLTYTMFFVGVCVEAEKWRDGKRSSFERPRVSGLLICTMSHKTGMTRLVVKDGPDWLERHISTPGPALSGMGGREAQLPARPRSGEGRTTTGSWR